jgi:YihY family inner membrane protein
MKRSRYADLDLPIAHVLRHPGRFALQVAKGFRANQGFLLSGAVAYYTLLSIVPLFTFLLLVLSRLVDENVLLTTLTRYLALVIPGETALIAKQANELLVHREIATWLLVGILLFFGSLAFSILENAMSVIFFHRVAVRRRHFLVSALLPYLYILLLGLGLLVTTVIASMLQALGEEQIRIFGQNWSLDRISVTLLYITGIGGEILLLTSIYMVMPVGRLRIRHALIGGIAAGLLWELTRRVLVWYFATLSLVGVVYGSFATTIVALLTLEIAAMILLFGAQVIAEYERLSRQGKPTSQVQALHTETVSLQ